MSRVRFRWKVNPGELVDAPAKAAAAGLRKTAQHLLTASRAQTPIERGHLRASGRASVDAKKLRAAVSYDTPYAVYQHERFDLKHPRGGNAKYLETPARTEATVMRNLVAAEIRRALRKGGR